MQRWPSSTSRRSPAMRRPRPTGIVLLVVAFTLGLLGSCSGERPELGEANVGTSAAPGAETTTTAAPAAPVGLVPSAETLLGYIATPIGDPVVRAEPDAEAGLLEIGPTTEAGAPTTFAVLGDPTDEAGGVSGWYQVLLPTRPNESTGWVAADDVTLSRTTLRITVDLAGRTLKVSDDGTEVLSTEVAIGTAENPTPVGATFVTELIENVEPEGSYGPYAFGLALHSDTLSEFNGGPGQVGIHGTNAPDLIGQAVSHGCVRLTNEAVGQLVDLQLPLGVPVLIT